MVDRADISKNTGTPKDGPAKVITLGCRLNAYESDIMAGHARDNELGNTVIINSCAVTNKAVADSRAAVRKAKRDNPDARIIVTGCAAQLDPTAFAAMSEVDHVLGNAEKMVAPSFDIDALTMGPKIRVNDIMSITKTAPQFISGGNRVLEKSQSRTRAFLQIQNGCDHRCTFCIIPYGRGPSRSVPAGEVVGHVRALVREGYKEVVLTGVDLSSWGGDLPGTPPLGDLVRRILKLVPELPRLRLSSIDPAEVDDSLMDALIHDPRMMPYLHLSMQHGDNLILKRMKRRHSREDAVALCETLIKARPEFTFGADIIAGFPTETDAAFEQSLSIVEQLPISWLHVFPYSAREGTPAAKIPPIKGDIIKARAKALREQGARMKAAHLTRRIGTIDMALFEEAGDKDYIVGRLPDFSLIKLDKHPSQANLVSTMHRVKVTGSDGDYLLGHVLDEAILNERQ